MSRLGSIFSSAFVAEKFDSDTSNKSISGTAAETPLYTTTLPQNKVEYDNQVIIITITGKLSGLLGARTLKIKLGNSTLVSVSDSLLAGDFVLRISIFRVSETEQKAHVDYFAVDNDLAKVQTNLSGSENFSDELDLVVTGKLGNVLDKIETFTYLVEIL
jgi:hypothetical protein